MLNALNRFRSGTLRVLMYHKVHETKSDGLTVSTIQLQNQLEWLSHNFNFVTLSEVIEAIEFNKKLPPRSVLITFDDGFLNNFDLAYPIFEKLEIPFSIFLVSDFIGKNVQFDNEEQSFLHLSHLKKMIGLVEFGLHSTQHQSIMDIPVSDWADEISTCKEQLENLGIQIQPTWAYTYGANPRKTKGLSQILNQSFQKSGIKIAFRIGNRINILPIGNPYLLERIDIKGHYNFETFIKKVNWGKIF